MNHFEKNVQLNCPICCLISLDWLQCGRWMKLKIAWKFYVQISSLRSLIATTSKRRYVKKERKLVTHLSRSYKIKTHNWNWVKKSSFCQVHVQVNQTYLLHATPIERYNFLPFLAVAAAFVFKYLFNWFLTTVEIKRTKKKWFAYDVCVLNDVEHNRNKQFEKKNVFICVQFATK